MKISPLHRNQQGMAAIFVTMIMMIVISLIVITFSTIIRREQRQALDRQLSAQAFYAAETGVNLAVEALNDGNVSPTATTDCNNPPVSDTTKLELEPNYPIKVSCLMIAGVLETLEYNNVDTDSKVIRLRPSGSGSIQDVEITWSPSDALGSAAAVGANCNGRYPDLPAPNDSGWLNCPVGVLRIDLVPTPSGTFNRDALLSSQFTAFGYPTTVVGSGSIGYATARNGTPFTGDINAMGRVQQGLCSGSNPVTCRLTITGVNSNDVYLRISSIYRESNLVIRALNGGNPVSLTGSQVVIDSTGQAVDVLRRIQVRVSLESSGKFELPDFAMEATNSICKRLQVNRVAGTLEPPSPDTPACRIN